MVIKQSTFIYIYIYTIKYNKAISQSIFIHLDFKTSQMSNMSYLLSRVGLSDTKHQLKLSEKNRNKTTKEEILNKTTKNINKQKQNEDNLRIITSQFTTRNSHNNTARGSKSPTNKYNPNIVNNNEDDESDDNCTLLKLMIKYLMKKEKSTCAEQSHQNNLIKFLCLEENCPKKIGCSYCFLQHHKSHVKLETKICVKDLKELDQLSQKNRRRIKDKLIHAKEDIIAKINQEITSIEQEFHNSMKYISKKIYDRIQENFQEKIKKYSSYEFIDEKLRKSHQIQEIFQQSRGNHSSQFKKQYQKLQNQTKQNNSNFDSAILKFKNQLNQNSQRSHKNYQEKIYFKNKEKSNEVYKKDNEVYMKSNEIDSDEREKKSRKQLTKDEEENLLIKICRMNITFVEEYLKQQFEYYQDFSNSFVIFDEFYSQLNSSICEFFAAFKRNLPLSKFYKIDTFEPEVLKRAASFFDKKQ